MPSIRIIGQPHAPEGEWLHRFRNLGEALYVELRGTCAVDIAEIDASLDHFHIRDVLPERMTEVAESVRRRIREGLQDECEAVELLSC